MGVLLTLIKAIDFVFGALVNVYFFIVLGACLVSWVNADPYNPIVRVLRNLTEPVFWRIRKLMPFVVISGLDLSPVVLMIGLQVAQILVSGLLWQIPLLFAG
ncbi:YggT family protein [Desulfovibrio sp. OttesenSCG-928-F20]|nr:YggT family protein [Desulfovibrio sp. OttesenSCG-928-F20]